MQIYVLQNVYWWFYVSEIYTFEIDVLNTRFLLIMYCNNWQNKLILSSNHNALKPQQLTFFQQRLIQFSIHNFVTVS
jgi:hypothetical protein